ncbi:MAG TPA: hypothetical protein PLZ73_00755 [bacterium]|nr:hypothetical protein [bacterium]
MGRSETVLREGPARLKFISFSLQTEIPQGTFVKASAFFQLTAPVDGDEKVFFHLAPAGQKNPVLNADFYPKYPTSLWAVGQTVEAGPIGLTVPGTIAPGEYDLRTGLMEIDRTGQETRYIREKFTNPEIKDFTVGRVRVVPPADGAGGGPGEGEQAPVADLDIVSFEKDNDVLLWQPVGARVERYDLDELPVAAVAIVPDPSVPYPGVELNNFFQIFPQYADWSLYDALQVGLSVPGQSPLRRLFIQISDAQGRMYKKEVRLKPGESAQELLDMVTLGGVINISRIARVKIFSVALDREATFYVTGLRLLARGMPTSEPTVEFVRLECPASVKRGEVFFVKVFFSLKAPVFAPCKLFVHIYRENDLQGAVNGDNNLVVPVRQWPLKQEVGALSSPVMIRPDAPPGRYLVRAGLYTPIQSDGVGYIKTATWDDGRGQEVVNIEQPVVGEDYIKQPYTDPKIEDWVVGSIQVE